MGGRGSGHWYRWDSKPTAEQYLPLDVNTLSRNGLLDPGTETGWQWTHANGDSASVSLTALTDAILVSYSLRTPGENWEQLSYQVQIDWSGCNYGGCRPWFRCPNQRCQRRVGKLYGGRYFLCRHCHGLAYTSQREHAAMRMATKAHRIRARLGGNGSAFDSFVPKPKGMHWRTYHRLIDEMHEAETRSDLLMLERFAQPID